MYRRFVFEGDIHASLSCVPLVIRRKLDLAASKISLAGWQALSRAERLSLCHLPVDSADDLAVYREVLQAFAARAGVPLEPLWGEPCSPADWAAPALLPRLREKLGEHEHPSAELLARLGEEERYALHKLSEPRRGPDKLRLLLGELAA
jgi:hypothetical protein